MSRTFSQIICKNKGGIRAWDSDHSELFIISLLVPASEMKIHVMPQIQAPWRFSNVILHYPITAPLCNYVTINFFSGSEKSISVVVLWKTWIQIDMG
jgi:hypothetical protein